MSGEFQLVNPSCCCAFAPLWSEEVTFKRRYHTTFLDSEDGSEQRSGIVTKVLRAHSFTIQTKNQAETGYLRRRLTKYVNKVWDVPVWPYEMTLTSEATAGTNTLNVDTTANREIATGSGEKVLLRSAYDTVGSGEIGSFTGTTITLTENLAATWPSGTKVYPLLRSVIGTAVDLTNPTPEHSKVKVEFIETFRSELAE